MWQVQLTTNHWHRASLTLSVTLFSSHLATTTRWRIQEEESSRNDVQSIEREQEIHFAHKKELIEVNHHLMWDILQNQLKHNNLLQIVEFRKQSSSLKSCLSAIGRQSTFSNLEAAAEAGGNRKWGWEEDRGTARIPDLFKKTENKVLHQKVVYSPPFPNLRQQKQVLKGKWGG